MDTPKAMKRSLSASTVRTVAKSTGAIDRALETLLEERPLSPTASTASRPFTEKQRESVTKSPKLPVRSHTSPTLPSGRLEQHRGSSARRPRARVCVRCENAIDDGRWIQMEGGNVLCDKCWKNMYLPKVRPPVASASLYVLPASAPARCDVVGAPTFGIRPGQSRLMHFILDGVLVPAL